MSHINIINEDKRNQDNSNHNKSINDIMNNKKQYWLNKNDKLKDSLDKKKRQWNNLNKRETNLK